MAVRSLTPEEAKQFHRHYLQVMTRIEAQLRRDRAVLEEFDAWAAGQPATSKWVGGPRDSGPLPRPSSGTVTGW